MSKRHRIGIIGTGRRATAFVMQLYEGMDRAELFGLCDVDEDRLGAFIGSHKLTGVRTFTDPQRMLAEKDLDAVIVTVPEFAHCQVTVAALKAGKPVYLEKPIAHNLDDARRMIDAQRETGTLAFVGFNLRASPVYNTIRQILRSGAIGQVLHIEGIEQLHVDHIASFMRRFHRRSELNGGFLNSKCCHDLDIMQWLVGHEHRIVKISSFGGCNVFLPEKQPAGVTHCHHCPTQVYRHCPYKAPGSDDIRQGRKQPTASRTPDIYPGDLCVYTPDKDLIDNQTIIMEWEHGVRGSFNLQGFQHHGDRMMRIWGERGTIDMEGRRKPHIRVTFSEHGDVEEHHFEVRQGGHGGTDGLMIDRFVDAIQCGGSGDSGLAEGYAATLVALKADESRLSGATVQLDRAMYG